MPVELECKLRVERHDEVRSALEAAGAEFVGRVAETNTIFDSADGSLRRSERGLRVRSIEILEGRGPGPTLTYKGPRQGGPFKRREEIETGIGDVESAVAMLRALGYIERLVFEKRRETWRIGACIVELDEVPTLGRFVEIEGPDDGSIREVMDRIGLAGGEHIGDGYVTMLMAGRDAGDRAVQIVFE